MSKPMIAIGTSFAAGLQGVSRVQPIRKPDAPEAKRDTSLPDDIVALSSAALEAADAAPGAHANTAPADAEVAPREPANAARHALSRGRWQKALSDAPGLQDAHLIDTLAE